MRIQDGAECGKNSVGLFLVSVGKIKCKISVGVQSHNLVKPHSVEVVLRLSWGCDNIKAKNIFILSQTGPWEILVRVAIPMRTACACGYSHAHNTLILVYISERVAIAKRTCLWLSHAHVYCIQIRVLRGWPGGWVSGWISWK